jgi:hypothetical protein
MDKDKLLKALDFVEGVAEKHAVETGADKREVLVSLNPKDGEPSATTIGDFNETGEVMCFACMRLEDMPVAAVKGCIVERCDGCGKEIWMAPSSREVYAKTAKKIVLCIPCVAKVPPTEIRGLATQLEELKEGSPPA